MISFIFLFNLLNLNIQKNNPPNIIYPRYSISNFINPCLIRTGSIPKIFIFFNDESSLKLKIQLFKKNNETVNKIYIYENEHVPNLQHSILIIN